jgi:hypothetical protein
LIVFIAICSCPLAAAEEIGGGNLRVSFSGSISPAKLPRTALRPISVSVSGTVTELAGARPPALHEFRVAINRHAHLSLRGLPVCRRRFVKAKTTRQALARCRDALVGDDHFSAHID